MSAETLIPPNHPRFCPKCGCELLSVNLFCSSCGASLTALQSESGVGAFGFHSRWLVLVIVLAMMAGSINLYLTNAVIFPYVVLIIVRNKLSMTALIGKIPPCYNWWPIVFMAVGGLAYSLGAIVVVMYPLAQFDSELVNEFYSETTVSASHISFFILTVILAPLIEETVFRGLLFSRLTKKWGMTTAMVVSSLAFALLHLNPIGSFVFGIVACVFYSRTGTLLVPMVFHALNNFIVWILMFSGGDAGSAGIDLGSPELLAQFAYAGLIAMTFGAPIVFIFMGKWWPSRETPTPYEVNIVNNRIRS